MREPEYKTPEITTVSAGDLLTGMGPAQATLYSFDDGSGSSGSSGGKD